MALMLPDNFWMMTVAGAGGWLLFYGLLMHARLKIYWNKSWRGSLIVPPVVSVAYWIVRLLPYPVLFRLLIFFAANPQLGPPGVPPIPPVIFFLAGVVLFSVLDSILSWHHHRLERRLAGRAEKVYSGSRRGVTNSWVLIVALLLLWIFRMGPLILILGYLIWRGVRSRSSKTTAGKGSFKLEENVPLYSEILRLARPVGKVPKNIFVRARQTTGGMRNVPLIEPGEGNRASMGNPVFPVENFICINPNAFSAALARRWAREVKPDSLIVMYSSCGGCITLVLVILALMMAIPLILSILPSAVKSSEGTVALVMIAVVGIVTALILRLVGLFRTPYEALQDGLRIWADQIPDQGHVGEFVNALGEYHSFTRAIADADLVVHQFRLSRPIRKLLRRNNMDVETALNALRLHLEENPVWPADNQNPHDVNA